MKTLSVSIFFLLSFFQTIAQQADLESFRLENCGKNCDIYIKNKKVVLDLYKQAPQGPQEINHRKNKLKKLFQITYKNRIKLFPFSIYDSIYIVTPNPLKDITEPRNYLSNELHQTKRLITESETKKLSNIFFNYYKLTYSLQDCVQTKTGCECPAADYPKILFLFKDGKNERYIGLPDDCYHRTNFSNEEYAQLDLSKEKAALILDLFKDMKLEIKPFDDELILEKK